MGKFAFGPGEEKLATAFELILGLQQQLLRLAQRGEVDTIFISVLLDELSDPKATLERWKTRTAPYYTEKALSLLSQQQMEYSNEELKARLDMWTEALESRVQSDPDSD